MILVCETCKASFLVPSSVLSGPPRKVKCGRCGHTWLTGKTPVPPLTVCPPQKAQEVFSKEQMKPLPSFLQENVKTETEQERDAFPPSARWGAFVLWGTGIALGSVALLLALALILREPIVRTWPSIQDVYQVFGLVKGAEENVFILRDIRSVRRYQEGAMRLIVTGQILNQTSQTMRVPVIDAEALSPDKKIIQAWQIAPVQATLGPKAILDFSSVVLCPDESVSEVTLRFAGVSAHDE